MRERWLEAERFSLRDLLERSDAAALAAWRGALMGDVAAARVVGDVTGGGDESFSDLFSGLPPAQREEARRRLERLAADPALTPDPLHRARYWRLLADLVSEGGPDEACLDRAAGAVREAVSRPPRAGGAAAAGGAARAGWPGKGRVRVAAPVRIDFGGAGRTRPPSAWSGAGRWSTPPSPWTGSCPSGPRRR